MIICQALTFKSFNIRSKGNFKYNIIFLTFMQILLYHKKALDKMIFLC